jgi:nicotinate-nucleotide--dimethylbenzimidazole phosphoribosyltransferase
MLEDQIKARLDSLTKPPGSLGRLEELALRVGLIQNTAMPIIGSKAMLIYCANHGVVEEGVSAYPAEVTRQMMANFQAGGAAINVLCRNFGIEPVIVDMGVDNPTRNFTREAAMTREETLAAIDAGRSYAQSADIIGAGEMGIANTTAAAALLCALTGIDPEEAAGRGTGLDDAGLVRKIDAIRRGLALHRPDPSDPFGILAALGGREIAAIVGLILGAAEHRRVIMLDGFISCSAGLVARAMQPKALDNVLFAHRSAERGHRKMLEALEARPLLDLEMRLGEGTGAALGIAIVEASVKLYREMATFSSAGVSTAPPTAARDLEMGTKPPS